MEFIFRINEVNKEFLIKYPYASLDGDLSITINSNLFFNKEQVSLLELATNVNTWLSQVRDKFFSDFDYSSDQYADNPVLHFERVNDRQYSIHSAWVKNFPSSIISLDDIISCFKIFLQELDSSIQQAYGVAFADIPAFKIR
jgi:hypothetical protein